MDRRTGDAPMDFEYENRRGLRDVNSPWPPGDPTKHGFASSNFPPANPARNAVFGAASFAPHTPLKSSIQGYRENPVAAVAFSDTENPSSPDNADNDDTPEPDRQRPLPASVTQFRGSSFSKTAAHKSGYAGSSSQPEAFDGSSASGAFGGTVTSNAFRRISSSFTLPARWSRNRPNEGQLILQRRAHKRKRPRYEALVRRHEEHAYSDSDADEFAREHDQRGSSRAVSQSQQQHTALPPTTLGVVPAFFTYLHSHPDLPSILSSYGQTLLTWFLVAVLVFLVWTCWSVVRADVELAVQEAAAEIVREVGRCAEEFRRNGCGSSSGPPPALAMACREWHDCMTQDPLAVGRARVGARTFSRILNSFFEGMSWKFLSCVGLLLVLVACNARALVPPFVGAGAAPAHHALPPPPAGFAPGRHPSAQGAWHPDTHFQTPYFAPPATPGGRRRSPERPAPGLYMSEDPGEGMLMGSPSRASPRKLGYI